MEVDEAGVVKRSKSLKEGKEAGERPKSIVEAKLSLFELEPEKGMLHSDSGESMVSFLESVSPASGTASPLPESPSTEGKHEGGEHGSSSLAQSLGRKLSLSKSVMRSKSLGHRSESRAKVEEQNVKADGKPKQEASKEWFSDAPNARELLASMSIKEIRFQAAIYEIYTTECDYVDSLDLLFEKFYAPLRLTEGIMKSQQVDEIFGPLKEIIHVNKALLKALRERRQKNFVIEKIGDLFINAAEDFKLYSTYCCNYDHAVALLNRKMTKEKVANFIKEAESDPRMKKVPLVGFLVKPVQRATRYPLLLREVLKHCDPAHPDYPNIQVALEKMQQVASKVDQDMGSTAKIQQITAMIQARSEEQKAQLHKLASPNRKFIQDFVLEMYSHFSDRIPVHIFLFNDHTIITLDQSRSKKKPRLISIWENTKCQVYKNLENLKKGSLGLLTSSLSLLPIPSQGSFFPNSPVASESSPSVSNSSSDTLSAPGSPNPGRAPSPSALRRISMMPERKEKEKEHAHEISETSFALAHGDELLIFEGEDKKEELIATFLKYGFENTTDPVAKNILESSVTKMALLSYSGTMKGTIRKTFDRRMTMLEVPDPHANTQYDVLKTTSDKLNDKEGVKKGEHELVLYTYASAAWCDICGEFIWGFKKQAYKCKFCFLDCHEKCLSNIDLPCVRQDAPLDSKRRQSYMGPKPNKKK